MGGNVALYARGMLIAQITDCHVVAPGELVADRVDSAAALSAAVCRINELPTPPAIVVATGDLVNDERPDQYDRFQEIVAELDAPLVPLPGNHDDRGELRARFADVLPQGGPDDPIDHVLDLAGVRLVFLDTQVPGRVGGAIRQAQLSWLDGVLSEVPDSPTLVFQHHPPFETGIGFMDREAFEGGADYTALLQRHRHVAMVSCGHLHRTIVQRIAGTVACTWPSTCVALDLGLGDAPVRYTDEPNGFVVHDVDAVGRVRSHVVPVGSYDRWTPAWAVDAV